MSGHVQARVNGSHITHAVRDANGAVWGEYFTMVKPICGKVKGRDAWGTPTMRLVFNRATNKTVPFDLAHIADDPYFTACGGCVRKLKAATP